MRRPLFICAVFLALAACGGADEPNLLNIKQDRSEGPDEFAILPSKPLQMPEDLAALPPPTPGGSNLSATRLELSRRLALNTTPMPPWPILSRIRYSPTTNGSTRSSQSTSTWYSVSR